MRLRLVIVPVLVAAAFGAGCSLITSYDGYTGGSGDTDATVVDAGPTTEDTLCAPEIPAQPMVNQPPLTAEASLTYYGVVDQLSFISDDPTCPLGKNLDGLNTCGDAGNAAPACHPTISDPTTADAGKCDGPGGIDNVAAGLLVNVSNIGRVNLVAQIPIDLAAQRTGFLLGLSNWGGSKELNNPSVNVEYYPDIGVATDDQGMTIGTLIDQASLGTGGRANYEASSAYIVNGVLVAKFPGKIPLHFHAFLNNDTTKPASVVIPISYAAIIGIPEIDPTTNGLTMNKGQLVGRLEVPDLVTSLTALYGCINDNAVSVGLVCPLPDLTSTPGTDGTGPTCDALSLAVGFDLIPSARADAGPAVPTVDLCSANDLPVDPDICAPAGSIPPTDAGGDDDDASDADVDDAAL